MIDKIFNQLSLGMILRHFISGFVFLVAFMYTKGDNTSAIFENLDEKYLFPAFLIGMFIYCVHRCTTNPLFECCRTLLFRAEKSRHNRIVWGTRDNLPFFSRDALEHLKTRWCFTRSKSAIEERFQTWGDYVHFQYTCGFAAILGTLIPHIACSDKMGVCPPLRWELILLGLLLISSSFLNDVRKQVAEKHIYEEAKAFGEPS